MLTGLEENDLKLAGNEMFISGEGVTSRRKAWKQN